MEMPQHTTQTNEHEHAWEAAPRLGMARYRCRECGAIGFRSPFTRWEIRPYREQKFRRRGNARPRQWGGPVAATSSRHRL